MNRQDKFPVRSVAPVLLNYPATAIKCRGEIFFAHKKQSAGIAGKIDKNLSRRVQSGSTGCVDKSDVYTFLPVETVAWAVKNL
jgi:hypothetical protein